MSDYLPPEILTEILLKLPAKSLIRFTNVCKSWRSIIRSSGFISAHHSSSQNYALLRRYDKYDEREHYSIIKKNGNFGSNFVSEFDFPFKCRIGYFRIVGCCDGLLFLSDDFFVNPSHPVILWNPSIRKHVVLPDTLISPEVPHIVALGFGVANHVYKVVRLIYSRKSFDYGYTVPPQAEVFSLSTGRWRILAGVDHIKLRLLEFMWCQVFLNGFVHWLAYEPVNGYISSSSILTFDIGEEIFGEIILPDELARETVTSLNLSKIGGSLGAIRYDGEADSLRCDVWMMKEYGSTESWTKLYRIDEVEGIGKVVGFWGRGEALLALKGLELVCHCLEGGRIEYLGVSGTPRSFYFDDFKESLLLLEEFREADEDCSRDALEWPRF